MIRRPTLKGQKYIHYVSVQTQTTLAPRAHLLSHSLRDVRSCTLQTRYNIANPSRQRAHSHLQPSEVKTLLKHTQHPPQGMELRKALTCCLLREKRAKSSPPFTYMTRKDTGCKNSLTKFIIDVNERARRILSISRSSVEMLGDVVHESLDNLSRHHAVQTHNGAEHNKRLLDSVH